MQSSDLCIPKMNTNIPKQKIIETLLNTKIGKIERLTEIPLKQNPLYKRILFTITWDSNNPLVKCWQQRIIKKQTLKLVPNKRDPQYWLITASCCPCK